MLQIFHISDNNNNTTTTEASDHQERMPVKGDKKDAAVQVGLCCTAVDNEYLNIYNTEHGSMKPRRGSLATVATCGSPATNLHLNEDDLSAADTTVNGSNTDKISLQYRIWRDNALAILFRRILNSHSQWNCSASKSKSMNSPSNRRIIRSNTLPACEHFPLSKGDEKPIKSPSSSGNESGSSEDVEENQEKRKFRKSRSGFASSADQLLDGFACELDAETLYGCDDIAAETQADRAILAFVLQTPTNKQNGRGIWLLNHQHSYFHKPSLQNLDCIETLRTLSFRTCHSIPNLNKETMSSASLEEIEKFKKKSESQLSLQHKQSLCLDNFPIYAGDDLKGFVDPQTHIDCSQLTNIDMPRLCPSGMETKDELLLYSRCMVGSWETVLSLSDSLDTLFKAFGIAYYKRVVIDKIAIPLKAEIENDDKTLHFTLTIPLGLRHMRVNFDGSLSIDEDPDCGEWENVAHIGEHSIPGFCQGQPFRALKQVRENKRIGKVLETRAILPDPTYGRIMYMQFNLTPKKGGSNIICNRILKPHKE